MLRLLVQKSSCCIVAIAGFFLYHCGLYAQETNEEIKKVILATYITVPHYTEIITLFKEGLEASVEKGDMAIEFVTIEGVGQKEEFISRLKEIEPDADLIFVPGALNAIAVKEAGVSKPVIFSAVTNPVDINLVESLEKPGGNFTGTTSSVSEERQVNVLRLALPQRKRIGILYDAGNPDAVVQADRWKEAALSSRLEPIEFTVPQGISSEEAMAETVRGIAGQVDVLVTAQDSTIAAYAEGLIRAANDSKLPTYVSFTYLVKQGALLALGYNFIDAVQINITQAISIIRGVSPGDIAVEMIPQYNLIINQKTARAIEITIHPRALRTATEIVE